MSAQVFQDYANIAVSEISDIAGNAWSSLSQDQKASLERAARRWLELTTREKAGENVTAQKLFVQTTLNEFKLAGQVVVHDAFWKGVEKALDLLGTFLGKAGAAFLQSAIQGAISDGI